MFFFLTTNRVAGTFLRLAGGNWKGEGRVEIFHSGAWGTVCDNSWDIKDAQVVCRELGFSGAISAPTRARFGAGSGPIWLTYVRCLGTESSIENCQHSGWNNAKYCHHYRDASVICSRTLSMSIKTYILYCLKVTINLSYATVLKTLKF